MFFLLLRNDSCVVDSPCNWFSDSSADSVDSVADNPSADDLLEYFFAFFDNAGQQNLKKNSFFHGNSHFCFRIALTVGFRIHLLIVLIRLLIILLLMICLSFFFFDNLIEFSSLFCFLNFAFFEHLAGMLM